MNVHNPIVYPILGALVADAASLGFHWLYNQSRIREIAGKTPAFRTPTASDYQGTQGYFAHGHKLAGDFSQYGEQAMVLLRSLVKNDCQYNRADYEKLFYEHFGYGGRYVGYIDHPTRDTLNNITTAEADAVKRAEMIPFPGDNSTKTHLIKKVLGLVKTTEGQELQRQVKELAENTGEGKSTLHYALAVMEKLKLVNDYHGADDEQLPAIAKLPALVAVYQGNDQLKNVVESAVRVTNNNKLAVQFGQTAATMIVSAMQTRNPEIAITRGCGSAAPKVASLIHKAISLKNEDNTAVTSKFGTSCNLAFGVPALAHNAITAGSYREAVQKNIYAGGDSCGRAILLGALLGAAYGVGGEKGIPLEWIDKLKEKNELEALLGKLHPA
ncbi:ADP-ribosylglycohydrolase family protein [Desulforhopalus sp. IMCC35007]|uniref:ADP-ribosylglycohydrolase family protein n=1 Tax=Desulforhopalus sp. IMCC35007 TaxID=2569543 RepID=UPI0010AEDB88|nr:ADP-ribosylglycohydrolase family protein [Desulforhopalus sp. IMCC35007]TKB10661.1 ADP-ribosylglycohydrolase family protein [Desulforhopalus sp. IMCC35007]